jgi:hypothetical protein
MDASRRARIQNRINRRLAEMTLAMMMAVTIPRIPMPCGIASHQASGIITTM